MAVDFCLLVLIDLHLCCDNYHAFTGAAAASTGAVPTAEAGQEGASPADSEFGSPQPGSEFAPEQPMDGDLGGDDLDFGQTGLHLVPDELVAVLRFAAAMRV